VTLQTEGLKRMVNPSELDRTQISPKVLTPHKLPGLPRDDDTVRLRDTLEPCGNAGRIANAELHLPTHLVQVATTTNPV
jgi:hypothetical protein